MKLIKRFTKDVIYEGDFDNIKELVIHCIKNKISLNHVELSNADLRGADLSNANLSNADLSNANLSNANLRGADLSNAYLSNANLRGADLSNAYLSNADLRGADLSNANLRGANLRGANLSDANLSDADLSNANLRFCIGNMVDVMSMQLQNYHIVFTKDVLAIGCKKYSIADWKTFDDSYIMEMDYKALDFWKKWKEHIFKTIEMCQE